MYCSVIWDKECECWIRTRISGTEKGQWYVGYWYTGAKNKQQIYSISSFHNSVDQDQLTFFSHAIKLSLLIANLYLTFVQKTVFIYSFLCPQKNFGWQIVIALSICASVCLSVHPSVLIHVWWISFIFFDVEIPYLVYGCILEWGSVGCQFFGHCYFDLDLLPTF